MKKEEKKRNIFHEALIDEKTLKKKIFFNLGPKKMIGEIFR